MLTGCCNYEKVIVGTYENDSKDSSLFLNEDNNYTARITYYSTDGESHAMNYHGTYKQKVKIVWS